MDQQILEGKTVMRREANRSQEFLGGSLIIWQKFTFVVFVQSSITEVSIQDGPSKTVHSLGCQTQITERSNTLRMSVNQFHLHSGHSGSVVSAFHIHQSVGNLERVWTRELFEDQS